MAPKKASLLPNNPPPPEPEEEEPPQEIQEVQEESEEEEVEESEEKYEVEEKEEQKAKNPQIQPSQVNKNPSFQKQITPLPPAPESDEEEGSESEGEGKEWEESDYPPSPNASDFTVMPITPKRPPPKDSKPAMKRPSQTQKDDEKDSRSRKKAKTIEEEEKKVKSSSAISAPAVVGRVWSEEDEIAVLQGMIDYQKKKGADPSNDMVAFHKFIRGKLFAGISKTQLYDKVRRFKKKFVANVEKAENGEDPVFSKPHEYKAFDLSKKIWSGGTNNSGSDDNANSRSNNGKMKKVGKIGGTNSSGSDNNANAKSNNGKVKKGGKIGSSVKEVEKKDVVMDDVGADTGDFLSKYPNLSRSLAQEDSSFFLADGVKSSLKERLSLIGKVKAMELEEQWKKLGEEEAEIFLKKLNLIAEQTKLLLDATEKRQSTAVRL